MAKENKPTSLNPETTEKLRSVLEELLAAISENQDVLKENEELQAAVSSIVKVLEKHDKLFLNYAQPQIAPLNDGTPQFMSDEDFIKNYVAQNGAIFLRNDLLDANLPAKRLTEE